MIFTIWLNQLLYLLNLYLVTTCLMWPYFDDNLEGHIKYILILNLNGI